MWDKLLGYFGDGLLRKFGEEPPAEWIEAIEDLNDFQIRRGFKRLMFGWKGGVPNLPDFVRLCRAIGDDAPDEGPSQRIALPPPSTQELDSWALSANIKFWKYLTHRIMDRGAYFPWGPAGTEELRECTRIALSYKNAWAQDMREAATVQTNTGEIIQPPEADQDGQFAECMRRAEADIAVYRAGAAA